MFKCKEIHPDDLMSFHIPFFNGLTDRIFFILDNGIYLIFFLIVKALRNWISFLKMLFMKMYNLLLRIQVACCQITMK